MARKLPEVITEEELIKVLKATKKDHHRVAFMLGFYECMRVSEIVKLEKENVRKNEKLIYIKEGKGHKDRNIPIAPEIDKSQILKQIPIICGIRSLQKSFNRYTKEALGKSMNIHTLRHSGITHYLDVKGWPIQKVQLLAGHSKIATTMLYVHIKSKSLIDEMWK